MQRPQKITLREMRADNGPRRLLVYCGDDKCAHSVIISAERWPDHVRLSDLEPSSPVRVAATAAPTSARCERAKMGTEAGSKSRFMAPGPAPPNVGLEKTPNGLAALVCSAPGPFCELEMTVWIYDQGEELKVFATEDATRAWFEENDPEGVAFEYEVLE